MRDYKKFDGLSAEKYFSNGKESVTFEKYNFQ